METVADAAGFVLAGGRSSRMGADKALVDFCGEPMLARTLRTLRAAGLSVAIAGARSQLESFAPVVPDESPDSGPLIGIISALASTQKRWAAFLSVDLPLLPPEVITYFLDLARREEAAVVVPSLKGLRETFPMVADTALLPGLRAAFAAGRSGCYSELRAAAEALGRKALVVPMEEAVASGRLKIAGSLPFEAWFLNTNTREELAQAESYCRGLQR